MRTKGFRVCLSVPLGRRSGTMVLREADGRVNGWWEVMVQRNTLSGTLSADGCLTLSGVLRTLVSTVPYTAEGTMDGSRLFLTLKTASGAYYSVSGEEFHINDEVLYGYALCQHGKVTLAVGELHDAVGELYSGTGELADGTAEFVDKTSDMDTQISDEIDAMTSSISGGDGDAVSFVSDKNTNVDSVQFVIKTAAIEKAEAAVDDVTESVPLTFWQKLLRLVGLYS